MTALKLDRRTFCKGNTALADPDSETVRSQNGLDSEMGTVLFLIIWPLDTAPSVTPTPPVFSRFGPLGAFTVVRFPPPPFSISGHVDYLNYVFPISRAHTLFLPFLYIHTHSEDRLPPF